MGYTWRKEAGVWKKVTSMFRKESGVWNPVKSGYQKVAGVFVSVFESEVIVEISTNQTDLILKDLFSSEDWASGKSKTVWIKNTATISPSVQAFAVVAQPAVDTGIWGGTLTLINDGIIQGKGGAANSGVGGNALYVGTVSNSTKKLQIKNYGTIRAGGGGGGKGGTGGGGQYTSTVTEGPYYAGYPASGASRYYWDTTNGSSIDAVYWNNSTVISSNVDSPHTVGSYTYTRGASRDSYTSGGLSHTVYEVSRSYQTTTNTSGGVGGAGGRGQGSDGANAVGTNGSAGGTNAGTGGKGGTGGTWGNSGAVGFTGSSGNRTAGTAGTAGGAAGYAYSTALYNIVVPGIILGRVA
ncbi:hypothetical protein EVB68_087 [Rhizobium phage RHph_Y2_6]|uniref:Uncharacterized protein n=2 Tax=Acanvirus TaxID=3044653 RepID=A0AAE8AW36_9CAUD|nr:hypothetical protein PP748_gp087 [Rhizobium phage RHph_Y2_6]YP_010658392.1 hypothetical protein PP750_gp82 [Rhizobium phage RHEph16]QIG68824.1 hypothetical protein EVB68_087 [Rhizobium phage RHph_Y2_6]QXV74391.1 hypothetical protein [Rhizobium phage RHEph16]